MIEYYNFKAHDAAEKQKLENKKRLKAIKLTFGVAAAITGIVIGAEVIEKKINPDIKYSGKSIYQIKPSEGLDHATMAVNRAGSIPYQAITEHIRNMPENTETIAKGLRPGDIIVIPETASIK